MLGPASGYVRDASLQGRGSTDRSSDRRAPIGSAYALGDAERVLKLAVLRAPLVMSVKKRRKPVSGMGPKRPEAEAGFTTV